MFLDKISKVKNQLLAEKKNNRIDVFELFSKNDINIIAEVKKASPSKGDINLDVDIVKTAYDYSINGASAVSVLTENFYFKGDISYIADIRKKCPNAVILNKDFIIDDYQIYEAKIYGADMILLIAALLDDGKINKFIDLSHSLGLEVLLEVHDEQEMKRALNTKARFIGVNNRNLKTLEIDLGVSEKLSKYIDKNRIFVSESGYSNSGDIIKMNKLGYKAFLIGTNLMKNVNPAMELKKLVEELKIAKS